MDSLGTEKLVLYFFHKKAFWESQLETSETEILKAQETIVFL